MSIRSAFAASTVLAVVAGSASAQYLTVDFSSQFNMSRTAAFLGNGETFPTGDNTNLGVKFAIGGDADPATNFAWGAYEAVTGGPATLTVDVNQFGVTKGYSLINTLWGQGGPTSYASITFTATNGLTYTKNLIGNEDIRDYNQFVWTNSINGTSTQEWWSNGLGQRLDMQEYILPDAFASETLLTISITDTGAADFQRAFVAGLTVFVPAPSTACAVLAGLGLIARRRR